MEKVEGIFTKKVKRKPRIKRAAHRHFDVPGIRRVPLQVTIPEDLRAIITESWQKTIEKKGKEKWSLSKFVEEIAWGGLHLNGFIECKPLIHDQYKATDPDYAVQKIHLRVGLITKGFSDTKCGRDIHESRTSHRKSEVTCLNCLGVQ